MLTLLKMIRSLLKSLNGDATPSSCAAAVLFGCLVGLVPFGVHTALFFSLLLVFRVPVGLGMLVAGVMTLLKFVLLGIVGVPLGAAMLAEGSLTRSIVVFLLDIPVIGLVPLERHAVLGGVVMALCLGLILWFPTMLGVRNYRAKLRGKLTGSKAYDKVAWLLGRPRDEDREWGRFAIIRWKLVLGVVVVFGLAGWLGAPTAIDRGVSGLLEEALMDEAEIGNVTCSIFSGDVLIEDLQVGGFGEGGSKTLTAKKAHCNISVLDLLRRKAIVENLALEDPSMRLETDENGKLVIQQKHEDRDKERGLDPKEIAEKAKETYGKIETARDWVQKVRDLMAYFEARDEMIAENPEELALLQGYTELPELGPRLVIRSFKVSGLNLSLEGEDAPDLRDFKVVGEELSSDPARHASPMSMLTAGLLGKVKPATFLFDSLARGADGTLRMDLKKMEIANLGVDLIKPLLGDTLPFLLDRGTIALDLGGGSDFIRGNGDCDLSVRLVLKDIRIQPRPGVSSLAGINSGELCSAVSDAGTFGLDVRITGNLLDPQVDVGNTMDLLMQMGAAAFRKAALNELESRYPGIGKMLSGEGGLVLPGVLTQGGDGPLAGLGDVGDILDNVGNIGSLFGGGDGGKPGQGGGATDLIDGVGSLLGGKKDGGGKEEDPAKKVLKGLGGLLGGKDEKKKEDGARKKEDPAGKALKGLGGLLGGKKDKKDD